MNIKKKGKLLPHIVKYIQNGSVEGFPVDEKTIGQFTGLRDINGNHIYEGDIVRYHFNQYRMIDIERIKRAIKQKMSQRDKRLMDGSYWDFKDILNLIEDEENHEKHVIKRKLFTTLNTCGLSFRTYNLLRDLNIITVGDLARCNPRQLRKARNLGPKVIMECETLLRGFNLDWNMDVTPYLSKQEQGKFDTSIVDSL